MNLDLSCVEPVLPLVNWDSPQWAVLEAIWGYGVREGFLSNVSLSRPFSPDSVDVIERLGGDVLFWYQRNLYSSSRSTSIDRYGLVGLSLLDLTQSSVILTEGVSDYLTMKFLYPDCNVLGFTTLGGNSKSTKILLSLFSEIVFITDNDFTKSTNTGLVNGLHLKRYYEGFGKVCQVYLPDLPYKDITQQFISQCKIRSREL